MIMYNGDLKSDPLKCGIFEDWISNGLVCKGLGCSYGCSVVCCCKLNNNLTISISCLFLDGLSYCHLLV